MQAQHALIIPVFNGERYILSLFVQLEAFLATHSDWHVYIVNDGSTDTTLQLLNLLPANISSSVTVLSYEQNRGKGGAIAYAMGMIPQSVSTISYTDIEIPYTFEPLVKGVEVLQQRSEVSAVIGDRTRAEGLQYSKYRQLATRLFRFFVPAEVRAFADTQAGCKVFRADVARRVFGQLQTSRWVFDIEVLSMLVRSGDVVETVPVTIKPQCAQGVGGLTFFRSSISVLGDMAHIQFPQTYALGVRYQLIFLWFIFFLISVVWYWKSLWLGFFADDFLALQVARDTTSWWSYGVNNIFGLKGSGSYGPVWNWVVEAQYSLFGMRPFGYHLVNLLVHALNATLLSMIAYSLIPKKSVSVFCGVLFLTLMGHVEAVAWFAAQVHIVAVCFVLCGLWCYVRSVQTQSTRWYLISLCTAMLAIYTKEIAVTVVVLYPLSGLFVRLQHKKDSLSTLCAQIVKETLPFVFILSTYLVLRYIVTHADALSYYGGDFSATLTYAHIAQFIVSITLSHMLPYVQRMNVASFIWVHQIWVVLFLACILVWFIFKKHYLTPLVFLVYLISLIPYVPLTLNRFSYEGERYGYFPGVWFALLVCVFVYELYSLIPKARTFCMAISVVGMVVWLSGSWYVVSQKLYVWQQANLWVQDIFMRAQEVPWENLGHTYIIGLPDSYGGAPLLPLGFVSGMSLIFDTTIGGQQLYLNSWVQGLPDFQSLRTSVSMKCMRDRGVCHWRAQQPRFIGHVTSSIAEGSFMLSVFDDGQPWAKQIVFEPTDVWCDQTTSLTFIWYDMMSGRWFFKIVDPTELCIEGV
jgi:glycosyltransferase involved in cell wall biosynthesis